MATDKEKSFIDKVWDFMASIKLAIVVFALIALTSIVGTILEQNAEPEKNIKVIGSLFGERLAPTLYVAFEKLGFFDMYRSWWFTTLLMLFAANLLVCSLDRFPRIWKLVKSPIKPLGKEQMEAIPFRKEFTLQGKPGAVKDKVLEAVRKMGMKVSESSDSEDVHLFGERGRHSRLGVYVTHLSILVILLGAVVGLYFGFKGFVEIPEGATYVMAFRGTGMLTDDEDQERRYIINALHNAKGDVAAAAANLGVEEGHLRARLKRFGVIPFGFGVRLDDFDVDFYGMSDMAKEYSSVLTVVDGGRDIFQKRIEVNDPLKYKGITMYQSSYGLTQGGTLKYILRVSSASGQSETLAVRRGEQFKIPGTSVTASVLEFNPALAFDPSGRPYTYSQFMNNPSASLEITDASGTYTKWIMRRNPKTWSLATGDVIEFRDVIGAQKTGLQVRSDPGVWMVYLGCAIMAVGLYMAFFMNHKKLWVVLSPSKGSTSVTVAASANKNRETFERKIDKMISRLREGGK